MKNESEEKKLARQIGGQVRNGKITLDLTQARMLAQELEILEALVDRGIITPEYELRTPYGLEPLLDQGVGL